MLIRLIVERLRAGLDGQPFTLCGDRVFGALVPNDIIKRFEAEPPFCVVAPAGETAEAFKVGESLERQTITRRFIITAVFERHEQDDVVGMQVAEQAEVLRDQLMAAFLDWRAGCGIDLLFYSGQQVVDMPSRAAVAYSFTALEDYDHDRVRQMMYDAGGKLDLRVNVRGVSVSPHTIKPCEE